MRRLPFFIKLVDIENFLKLVHSLAPVNHVKKFIDIIGVSEHFIESYFEWLVDLGVLKPTKGKFGSFILTDIGCQLCNMELDKNEIIRKYVQAMLNSKIEAFYVVDADIWEALRKSIGKLGHYAQSEVNPLLFSALPLVLNMQVYLITECHSFISIEGIVKRLKVISPNYGAIFSWDNIVNEGYLKLERMPYDH